LQRTPALERDDRPTFASAGRAPERGSELLAAELGPSRESLVSDPLPQPEPAQTMGTATITGFMTIDGSPQEGGRVLFQNQDGSWQRTAFINYLGGFRVDDAPTSKLALSFELPPQSERQVFVPGVEVTPSPGKVEDLNLAWMSTQVNVKVAGD